MSRTRLVTTAIAAALAIAPAAAVAAPHAAAANTPTVYRICVPSAVVTSQPGKGILGNLVHLDAILVKRVSPSGRYAYGFARGTANKNGWIKVSAVCPHSGGLGDPRVHGRI